MREGAGSSPRRQGRGSCCRDRDTRHGPDLRFVAIERHLESLRCNASARRDVSRNVLFERHVAFGPVRSSGRSSGHLSGWLAVRGESSIATATTLRRRGTAARATGMRGDRVAQVLGTTTAENTDDLDPAMAIARDGVSQCLEASDQDASGLRGDLVAATDLRPPSVLIATRSPARASTAHARSSCARRTGSHTAHALLGELA